VPVFWPKGQTRDHDELAELAGKEAFEVCLPNETLCLQLTAWQKLMKYSSTFQLQRAYEWRDDQFHLLYN
jgi:hypothetical protein